MNERQQKYLEYLQRMCNKHNIAPKVADEALISGIVSREVYELDEEERQAVVRKLNEQETKEN